MTNSTASEHDYSRRRVVGKHDLQMCQHLNKTNPSFKVIRKTRGICWTLICTQEKSDARITVRCFDSCHPFSCYSVPNLVTPSDGERPHSEKTATHSHALSGNVLHRSFEDLRQRIIVMFTADALDNPNQRLLKCVVSASHRSGSVRNHFKGFM